MYVKGIEIRQAYTLLKMDLDRSENLHILCFHTVNSAILISKPRTVLFVQSEIRNLHPVIKE